jgi:plastocyanin
MRSIRVGGLIALVGLALAACGGGTSAPPAATAGSPSAATSASAPAASSPAASAGAVCEKTTDAATVNVEISNSQFGTDPVQAGVGDVIGWTNQDTVPHTATTDACGTDNLAQGQTGALVFSAPGTYSYFCAVHPTTMQGEIVISG